MISYLDGFTKRMELTACIASVIKRKNTTRAIELDFADEELDNIIFSVLIHIMERTLTEENDCTLDDIELFLSQILPLYKKQYSPEQLRELTRYIVKDILQNKGDGFKYNIMNYSSGQMESKSVRLIRDDFNERNEVIYKLTDDCCNMLFRTKEVDDILGFQTAEIQLKLLIERKNYSGAATQSTQLIQMLNEKQNELHFFEKRLRNDLNNTSGEEYDGMIRNIDNMLTDEYRTMEEIERTVKLASEHLTEEEKLTDKNDSELYSEKEHIFKIGKNVETILNKQRQLLTASRKLGNIYSDILKETIASHRIRCFDIEGTILRQLEAYNGSSKMSISRIFANLMSPLLLPELPDTLNIGLFYEPQSRLEKSDEQQEIPDEELDSIDYKEERIIRRNEAHILAIRLLFGFAAEVQGSFELLDFWEYCKNSPDILRLTDEKLIFLVLLNLYEYGCIDIGKWKAESNVPGECHGEFDLSYVLGRIYETDNAMYGVKSIKIEKGSGKTDLEWIEEQGGFSFKNCVEMDNLIFTAEVTDNA